ncbi:MAG: nucleoside-diphosphate kinase [Dehalococcoidia bacterium]|jgi:nucleoside-diphosphate kinase
MAVERTLFLVKPDAVQRGLAGEIIKRLESRGLKIVGLKLMQVSRATAEKHYGEHKGKPFFEGLVSFITSSPIVAVVFEGTNAIEIVRATNGATNPLKAAPGTVRADFGLEMGRNLVHASDSPQSAAREIKIFFKPAEIIDWKRDTDAWIYE